MSLSCHGLRVQRGTDFRLDVPSMKLVPGTVTAVCGPNGSGKSTLLLACAGLIDLVGGRVDLDDTPYHQGRAPAPAERRAGVVLVHQDPYLLRGTVRRNLSWGLRLRRVAKPERHERAAAVLSALGIADFATRDVDRLSGGQQTLVAVARALVLQPTVLLLDEVTRDLDTGHRLAVKGAVQQLSVQGATVLLATHDQEMVARLAHERLDLRDGQLVSKEA